MPHKNRRYILIFALLGLQNSYSRAEHVDNHERSFAGGAPIARTIKIRIDVAEGQPPVVEAEARRAKELIESAIKNPKMQPLFQALSSPRIQIRGGAPSRSYIDKPGDGIRINPFAIQNISDFVQMVAHEGAHNRLATLSEDKVEHLKAKISQIIAPANPPEFYPRQRDVFFDEFKEALSPYQNTAGKVGLPTFSNVAGKLGEAVAIQNAKEAVREHAVVNAMEYAALRVYLGIDEAKKRMKEDRFYPEISNAVIRFYDQIEPILQEAGLTR